RGGGSMGEDDFGALDEGLQRILNLEGRPLSGLSVALVRDGEIRHEGYWGMRRFACSGAAADCPAMDEPVDSETRWRVASISKPITTLGVLHLVEQGLLDLDADVSDCLGYPLRNPNFPDRPISLRMLLSHTSSLRDAEYYFPPLSHELWELFLPGGRHFDGGIHYAKPVAGRDLSPGACYAYCNLGYALAGEMIEKASGLRFDLYMQETVFGPLGIDGGFNPLLVSDRHFLDISPIYRKQKDESLSWNPEGPWYPQVDDFRGIRPVIPVRLPPEAKIPAGDAEDSLALENYRVGTNGSLFSPQGGMRISAHDLARILILLIDRGECAGGDGRRRRLFKAASIDSMLRPEWIRDEIRHNYDDCEETKPCTWEFGLGLYCGEGPDGRPGLWGHHGDAYGFLGGMFLDPERRSGYVYLIGGTGADPDLNRGTNSRLYVWDEKIRALIEAAL
ncbi:MAG: beta-lactamase family protein, partial [Spirochaetaceae bacterium]|nr:beta-lactamase family protein [Spirochaetaceae bacterium]